MLHIAQSLQALKVVDRTVWDVIPKAEVVQSLDARLIYASFNNMWLNFRGNVRLLSHQVPMVVPATGLLRPTAEVSARLKWLSERAGRLERLPHLWWWAEEGLKRWEARLRRDRGDSTPMVERRNALAAFMKAQGAGFSKSMPSGEKLLKEIVEDGWQMWAIGSDAVHASATWCMAGLRSSEEAGGPQRWSLDFGETDLETAVYGVASDASEWFARGAISVANIFGWPCSELQDVVGDGQELLDRLHSSQDAQAR